MLLVAADGRIAGSVSGGCVEGAAAEEIERARADGRSRVIRYGISDEQAWDVGLACGGTIDVLVEPGVRSEVDRCGLATASGRTGGRAIVTPLPPDAPPAEFGQHEPGDGSPAASPRWSSTTTARSSGSTRRRRRRRATLVTSRAGRARAGHVADRRARRPAVLHRGVTRSGRGWSSSARSRSRGRSSGSRASSGYETVVIDGRAAFATPERFPDVDRLIVGWPDEVADEIGLGPGRRRRGADPRREVRRARDRRGAAARLPLRRRGRVTKTQADRRARLRAAGVTEEELARLRGPIGLDLGGRAPAETALAIMAEIVADRYGGSGAPMVERARRSGDLVAAGG